MSSTTRVGFVIPGVNDFADEGTHYDNNVTTYEAELPSNLSASLPGSGSYTGQIRTVALSAPNFYSAPRPYQTYMWNGSFWQQIGAFGFKDDLNAYDPLQPGDYVASTGTETFQANPIPGFSTIQVGANQAVRFSCNITTNSIQSNSGSSIFTGKFNIFVNPSSATQPTPTTPGATRLSFNLVHSDDGDSVFMSPAPDSVQYHYGELLWAPNLSSPTTIGVAAYLSATFTDDGIGTREYGGSFTAAGISTSNIMVEVMGEK